MFDPNGNVVQQQQYQAGQRGKQVAVVFQQPADTIRKCRLGDVTLRPPDHHGQAMGRRQGLVRPELDVAGIIEKTPVVLCFGTKPPRICLDEQGVAWRIELQPDRCGCFINRKCPVVTRHVPVKLVVLLEEPKNAIRTVAELVGVHAMLDKAIGSAKVCTHVAPTAHRVKGFRFAVTQDRQRFQCDAIGVAEAIFIVNREIPVNSAANLISFSAHHDGLGDFDHTVRHHANIAVKTEDALICQGGERQAEQHQCNQALHSTDPKFASGTLAASSEVFWKKSRCVNLNMPAMILLGTLSVIVL